MAVLRVETVVVNRGSRSVRVITRSCAVPAEDLVGSDLAITAVRPPTCDRLRDTVDLLPGASTATLTGEFRVDNGTNSDGLRVHQVFSPAFFTVITFKLGS